MDVYEMRLKIYVIKDINGDNQFTYIAQLIDKSLLKDKFLTEFHKQNTYKYYTFNGMFPLENNKIYKAGNIYTVLIRTVYENLVKHFEQFLVNEYTEYLKALTIEKRVIPKKHIEKIYSITPAIVKFDGGYWRKNQSLETFEKRLKENLIKKYNKYFNIKIEEEFELFTFIRFENYKPISTKYKNIHILGDKLTLNVAENDMAQNLAYLALGTGIMEVNSRGFGFVNYKWI